MRRTNLALAVLLAAAAPLAAQRAVVFTVYGGGADHLADLQKSPAAWFMPGYSIGASAGVQLTRFWSIHGDFTFTRNPVEGNGAITGGDVNRFFYGAHAEFQYPVTTTVKPFLFAGAGAVSLDQLGLDTFSPTTRPAVMYGGGLFFEVPATRLALMAEIKGLTYQWNMAGFDRTMVDVTYTAGLSYRLPF
jgi:hypothetical protein